MFNVKPNGGFQLGNFFTHWWDMNTTDFDGNKILGGEGGAGDDFTSAGVFYTPDYELGNGEFAAQNNTSEKTERQTSGTYSMGPNDAFTIAVAIKDGFGSGFGQFIGVNGATRGGSYMELNGDFVGFRMFYDYGVSEGYGRRYTSPKQVPN